MAKKPAKQAKTKQKDREIVSGDLALSKRYGVSTKTIQNWRGNGLPCIDRGHGFDYDVAETDPWVEAYRLEHADDEKSNSLARQIREAELRQELAKADKAEREEEAARGNILPRDEYELFASETIQNARDQLLRIPRLLRTHLCKKCQPKANELEKLIKTALEELAKLPAGPDKE